MHNQIDHVLKDNRQHSKLMYDVSEKLSMTLTIIW